MNKYDVVILGAGSGGIGAAVTASRAGKKVLLVEKFARIGGTLCWAGVNCWEPGVCSSELPREIYDRLRKIPNAAGVYSSARHCSYPIPGEPAYPGGENVVDPSKDYNDTLQRYGVNKAEDELAYKKAKWHGVIFEPTAYEQVVLTMLEETGNCEILCNTTLKSVKYSGSLIKSITLSHGQKITAESFIDSTGDICLARAAGCEITSGLEAACIYGEPDAPPQHKMIINGATLIYRIAPKDTVSIDKIDDNIPMQCWWANDFPMAVFNQYPCCDWNVNMLPTIDGLEAMQLSHNELIKETTRRVKAHWRNCQKIFPEFQHYRMSEIFPLMGIRESYRLVGRYVLTQHDLLAGVSGQKYDDIIAIADHAMDTHGYGGCNELDEPYGIPLRCLQPKEFDNLLVACRGASFSALAASSCRLSRTMISLGEAAAKKIIG